jgi:hypothetical protein
MVIGTELNTRFGYVIGDLNQQLNLFMRPISSSLWFELNTIHSKIHLVTQNTHRRYEDR